MPRKPIEITEKIEYLSILDENANVDAKLEPKLDNDTLKKMYRFMLLGRRTDERMLKMQRTGRLGTFPQASGHEAVSIGSVSAIEKTDWHIPAYRELAGMLYRGWSLEKIILYWNGYEEGAVPPEGVNDLPYCVPVASQLLHAAGVGMAMNIKGDKKVALTYFGDGSSSEGDFHEALNFASVFKAPVVFVCQNNQYAISVPLSKQMNCKTLAQRAVAYGMPGIKVDGNDVLAMYVATKEAVDRAKAGGGPTLIEGLTYRFTPHTTADDPKRYRSEDESKEWFGKEPLTRFAKYLQNKGVVTAKELEEMEAEVDAEIRAGIERSETLSKSEELMNPLAMFDYLYGEETEHLKAQKEELKQYLEHKKKGKKQQNHTAHAGSAK